MQIINELSPAGTWFELTRDRVKVKDPIVLIHGVGLDLEMWDPQIAALTEHFSVLRYDMLGHGKSKVGVVNGIGTFIDQLKDLLAYLEIDRCHLAGLSMGGVVAQGFAGTEHDRLKTLILMNTVYRRTEAELLGMRARLALTREEGLKPIADAAIARWFDRHFQETYPERIKTIREKMLSNQLEPYVLAYGALVEADSEIKNALTRVKCPALVITGELDPGSTPEIAHRMINDLTKRELAILPGLHHLTSWEAPDLVNSVLLKFLGRHAPRDA